MELPIEYARTLEKKIELTLGYALYLRKTHGKRLAHVVLPPAVKNDCLVVANLATPPCALYYQLIGAEKEETDAGSSFALDIVYILENYVLDLLHCNDRQGEVVWPYLLAPDGEIKGYYDGWLPEGLMECACIIEIKVMDGDSFGVKKQQAANQEHIEQAFAYASRTRSPYFVIIYTNRGAMRSTPFYQVFAFRITDMKEAERAVLELFVQKFDPVLLALHSEINSNAPMVQQYEFESLRSRCWSNKNCVLDCRKEQHQDGYCWYRGICPYVGKHSENNDTFKQAMA